MVESLWGVLTISVGWGVFGLFHSLLSRAWVKRRVERLFGPPFLAGLYRPLYALLSTAYLTWLWFVSYGLDGDRVFFSLPGWMVPFPFAAKAVAVVLIAICFQEIRFPEFTGAGQLFRWWRGELDGSLSTAPDDVPMTHQREPLARRGVYLWVRHPLNTAAFVWIWPQQNYTLYNVVFAGCLTAYILMGNRFEENDLVVRYGPAYERYRQIVPPFFSGFFGLQSRAQKLENTTERGM